MASTGDIWLQWFSCCFHQPQSPSRRRHHQRLRIDRSMIGNPTNFQHTGHIGSADVELSTNHLNAIQTQMQSKGGYEMNSIRLQVSGCGKFVIVLVLIFLFVLRLADRNTLSYVQLFLKKKRVPKFMSHLHQSNTRWHLKWG